MQNAECRARVTAAVNYPSCSVFCIICSAFCIFALHSALFVLHSVLFALHSAFSLCSMCRVVFNFCYFGGDNAQCIAVYAECKTAITTKRLRILYFMGCTECRASSKCRIPKCRSNAALVIPHPNQPFYSRTYIGQRAPRLVPERRSAKIFF